MKRSKILDYYDPELCYKSKRQMFEIIPGYMSHTFPPSTKLIREIK